MSKLNKSILLILIAAVMTACQKKSNETVTATGVSFVITSPVQGQVWHSTDSIPIIATASYTDEMHGYEIKITDTATGTIVYDTIEEVHNSSYTISQRWRYNGSNAATLKMELVVEVDHSGTLARKAVTFNYLP